MQPETMPDELTHRLWWKLGDVLRGTGGQRYFETFIWFCEDNGTDEYARSILRAVRSLRTPELMQRLESLYSELTWELMGPVP